MVYYLVYSENEAASVIMGTVNKYGAYYKFSVNCADNLWDEKQWGEEYTKDEIPECYQSERLANMIERIDSIVPSIHIIVRDY